MCAAQGKPEPDGPPAFFLPVARGDAFRQQAVYAFRMRNQSYQCLADAVLIAHASIVLFIVAGLLLILLGGALRWRWVRNFWLRALHLAAIGYVVAESWLGIACPLTNLEQWLRARAGQAVPGGDFIAYWIGRLLFYQAAPWVFIATYSVFALVVIACWVLVRPASCGKPGKPAR
jgi:hypothetical protein